MDSGRLEVRHIYIEENEDVVIHAPSIILQISARPQEPACCLDPNCNPWNHDCAQLTHMRKKLKTRKVYLPEDHSNLYICLHALNACTYLIWDNPPTSEVEKSMAQVPWFAPFWERINNAWEWVNKFPHRAVPLTEEDAPAFAAMPPSPKLPSRGSLEPYIPNEFEDQLAFIQSLTLPAHWEAPPCFCYLPGEEDWEYMRDEELEAWENYLEHQLKASRWTLDLNKIADGQRWWNVGVQEAVDTWNLRRMWKDVNNDWREGMVDSDA
ncbi:hypothetical protein BT96DRAFT_945653 [Gymnopus androsaceus JB14]|uniref:Uncharacterized protein n=1 Tax=Gymnopus androsaceus JB14 TaxID=1447944 RepID=A0A6A4H086_9AGAR|nr:hypothetical protein BT96DRAFT_945653 [Gymnopus androsaceus JB14]